MHFILTIGPTRAIFLKIVRKKEDGPKMSGFFQNNVWGPRSQDPGFYELCSLPIMLNVLKTKF